MSRESEQQQLAEEGLLTKDGQKKEQHAYGSVAPPEYSSEYQQPTAPPYERPPPFKGQSFFL